MDHSDLDQIDAIYPSSDGFEHGYNNEMNKPAKVRFASGRETTYSMVSDGDGVRGTNTEPSLSRFADNVFNRQSSYVNALGNRNTFAFENRESSQAFDHVSEFIPDRGFVFKLSGEHTGAICSVHVHPPSRSSTAPIIVTGGEDRTAVVWNLCTGEKIVKLSGGHTKAITSVSVYEPANPVSATLIVTASKDATAIMWDLKSGKIVHRLKGGHGVHEISCVLVYIPSDVSAAPLLITGGWDRNAVVWDIITGQQMYRLEGGHSQGISAMDLYNPGEGISPLVVTGSADDTAVVWDLCSGQVVRTLSGGHADRIYSVAVHAPRISICPPLVVTGSEDKTAVVWDLHSGSRLCKLQGEHTATITAIAVYAPPDGMSPPLVLTASADKTAIVWDVVTGIPIRRLTGCHTAGLLSAAVYSPQRGRGSPLFITGAQDHSTVIWDIWSSEQVRRLEGGHSQPVKAVAVYTPPEPTIPAVVVTGSDDKTAVVWDLQSQHIMHTLSRGHSGEVTSVVVYTPPMPKASPLVITGSEDSTAVVWEVFSGKQLHKLQGGHSDWITSLVVYESADRMSPPLVISGSYDRRMVVWDLETGKIVRKLPVEHTAAISSVAVFVPAVDSYATPLIISGSEDKSIIVWDLESGLMVRRLEGHTSGITSLVLYAPTDATVQILSASYDKTAIQWDLNSGKILRKFENGHSDWISGVALYPSPEPSVPALVITIGHDKIIVVWDLRTGKIIRKLDGVHHKTISSISIYAPKDKQPPLVITGSLDGFAALWKNALVPFTFRPLMDEVQRLFHADVAEFPTTNEPWRRVNAVIDQYGDGFWYENHTLFRCALTEVSDGAIRDSFFQTFHDALGRVIHLVPVYVQGSNIKCIMQIAVERKLRIRHLIYDAWLGLLNSHQADFLWQVFHPSLFMRRPALLALSDIYPAEFIDFICKLKLVRSHRLLYQNCSAYHINNFSGMVIEGMPATITVDMWTKLAGYRTDPNDTNAHPVTAYMLPLVAAADMKLLQAYVDVSSSCDDLSIFNSDVGSVAFRYAWRSFGMEAHISAMIYYSWFLSIFTLSVIVFDRLHQYEHAVGPVLAWILQAAVLRFVLKYILDEVRQCYNDYIIRKRRNDERMHSIARVVQTIPEVPVTKLVPGQHREAYLNTNKRFRFLRKACSHGLEYARSLTVVKIAKIILRHFSDFWNILDLAVIVIVLLGTLLRCIYARETDSSRSVLALGCVVVWFKLLYFMRPFKGSGPLVTMILRIMSDIKYFLFILAVVLTGFALAFWTISFPDTELPFGTLSSSFITTYLYMLGQDVKADFEGTSSPKMGVFLLVMFLMFMMIVMLNLLIALMGNSFKIIQSKGIAQWRLEQASMMLEQRFTLTRNIIRRHRHFSRIHVLKNSALVDKAKKEFLRSTENANSRDKGYDLLRRDTVLSPSESHKQSIFSSLERKLDSVSVASREHLDVKLKEANERAAEQLKALEAHSSSTDAKINNLEKKIDALMAKLGGGNSKDTAKFSGILNPFSAATYTTSSTNAATSAGAAASTATSSAGKDQEHN